MNERSLQLGSLARNWHVLSIITTQHAYGKLNNSNRTRQGSTVNSPAQRGRCEGYFYTIWDNIALKILGFVKNKFCQHVGNVRTASRTLAVLDSGVEPSNISSDLDWGDITRCRRSLVCHNHHLGTDSSDHVYLLRGGKIRKTQGLIAGAVKVVNIEAAQMVFCLAGGERSGPNSIQHAPTLNLAPAKNVSFECCKKA